MGVVRCVVFLALFGLGGCRGTYLEGVYEEEMRILTQFIESRGVAPWRYREVLCGVAFGGDSLRALPGDTLRFRYSVYALRGTPLVVETNDTAVARRHGLVVAEGDTLYTYVVGQTKTVEGLDMALAHMAHMAHGGSQLWVGVPSSLGYGGRQVGVVRQHTPLCYEMEIVGASSAVIE